jgi:hypothetical protein
MDHEREERLQYEDYPIVKIGNGITELMREDGVLFTLYGDKYICKIITIIDIQQY